MAQRRMFSLQIVDTDKFLDLPTSAQALYFHLGMHADDDGFVASPKRIMRSVGCREDDLSILVVKEFVIPFDSGVIVITDWKLNNTLKNDRYKRTIYQKEKSMLCDDGAGRYFLNPNTISTCNRLGSGSEPKWIQAGTIT